MVGSLDGVYMHAPGIAEVVFKYKDDALEAYKKYNQRNLDGQPMHCKLQAAPRSRISGAGASYGHGYVCVFGVRENHKEIIIVLRLEMTFIRRSWYLVHV